MSESAVVETQGEFLFGGGPTPQLHAADPRSGFYEEVAALWQLPVGQRVHVHLRLHHFADLDGLLELARAPALPLDGREPLALRIGAIGVHQPADRRVGVGLGFRATRKPEFQTSVT